MSKYEKAYNKKYKEAIKHKRYQLKRYRVRYTNKLGRRISAVVRATHGDNAYMYISKTRSGKNIQVNKI